MTQTRGRRSILVLRSGGGKGRGVRHHIDRAAVEGIWSRRDKLPPSGLVDAVIDEVFAQDVREATEFSTLEPNSDLREAVHEIEKSAKNLRTRIRNIEALEGGGKHFATWMRKFYGVLPGFKSYYPEAFLDEMLANLENVTRQYYIKVSPSGHWHNFIRNMAQIFERFDEPVQAADTSVFAGLLKELERQFPGIAFPPLSDGTEGRRDYIRSAIENLKSKSF